MSLRIFVKIFMVSTSYNSWDIDLTTVFSTDDNALTILSNQFFSNFLWFEWID